MKRKIYILLTMFLGLMLSQFVHTGLEMLALTWLVDTGDITWEAWRMLHATATVIIAVAGLVGGWFLGRHWWHVVYVEGRHFKWRKRPAKMGK